MAKQNTQYIPKFKSATAPGLALATAADEDGSLWTIHAWSSQSPRRVTSGAG